MSIQVSQKEGGISRNKAHTSQEQHGLSTGQWFSRAIGRLFCCTKEEKLDEPVTLLKFTNLREHQAYANQMFTQDELQKQKKTRSVSILSVENLIQKSSLLERRIVICGEEFIVRIDENPEVQCSALFREKYMDLFGEEPLERLAAERKCSAQENYDKIFQKIRIQKVSAHDKPREVRWDGPTSVDGHFNVQLKEAVPTGTIIGYPCGGIFILPDEGCSATPSHKEIYGTYSFPAYIGSKEEIRCYIAPIIDGNVIYLSFFHCLNAVDAIGFEKDPFYGRIMNIVLKQPNADDQFPVFHLAVDMEAQESLLIEYGFSYWLACLREEKTPEELEAFFGKLSLQYGT